MSIRPAHVVATVLITLAGSSLPGISSARTALASRLPARSAKLAQVRYIKGGLAVAPPHHKQKKGKVKQPLYNQYSLGTGATQRASIGFNDHTILHINQQTNLVLRSPHLTYVRKGEVDELLTPGSNHQVQTAAAVASAIGTNFDVRTKRGKTEVVVVHGAVEVHNKHGKVIVKTNQETVVQVNHKPSPPKSVDAAAVTSWTSSIPTPTMAENVALDANGGRIVEASSQRSGGPASHVDDGRLDTSWETAPGKVTNQQLTVAFDGTKIFMVSGVFIDGAASGKTSSQTDLKDFSVRYSNNGTADSDFGTLLTGTLKQSNSLQWFAFSHPIAIRYLQLVAKDNYGSTEGTSVAEFEAVGLPNTGNKFNGPAGIAVDPQGRIDVVDTGVIQRLTSDGSLLATLGAAGRQPGLIDSPSGLAVDKSGNIYVVSTRGRVDKFSADGKWLLGWGTPGSGPGQFAAPNGVATDSQGNVYVVDSNNDRIEKFSSTGEFLAQFGGRGTGPGQFSYGPYGIAVDAQGNMYVSEPATQIIRKLSPTGQELLRWGTGGKGPGQFSNPEGVAVDSQGNVYIADAQNNRIQKFTSDGKYLTSWSTPGTTAGSPPVRPAFLAVDSKGYVYVSTIFAGQVVQKYSPDGKLIATWR